MAVAARLFEEDKRAILAMVTKVKDLAKKAKSTINWEAMTPGVLAYLDKESAENWAHTFAPLVAGTVNTAGDFWSVELGVRFDVRNLEAEAWFQDYMLKFAQPITETTASSITNLIGTAMAEGLTTGQMQKLISAEFEQWAKGTADPETFRFFNTRIPPYRAEMIARTESIRAMNAGSTALFDRWGVKKKEWSSASDARTRTTHKAADGQVVDIDKPFNVGGYKLMYPSDGSLGAPGSEIINCRCSSLPVIEDNEVLKGDTPQIINENRTILKDDSKFRDLTDASELKKFRREWSARAKLLKQNNQEAWQAFKEYTGKGYSYINRLLRKGTSGVAWNDDKIRAQAEGIRNSMLPIGENVVVYRGLGRWKETFKGVESVDQLVGVGFTDDGFMSTTLNREWIGDNFRTSPLVVNTGLILRVEVDSDVNGFYVENISSLKDEQELILQDATSWIVTSITTEEFNGSPETVATIRRVR